MLLGDNGSRDSMNEITIWRSIVQYIQGKNREQVAASINDKFVNTSVDFFMVGLVASSGP